MVAGCQTDIVQFGRDILFVTTHLSKKFCGVVGLPVSEGVNGVNKFTFPGSRLETRMYIEDSDRELDIWIHIRSPDDDLEEKLITLVVTPVKKTCKTKDRNYQKCGHRSSCVRKELFCDGRVNCAGPGREPRGTEPFVRIGLTVHGLEVSRVTWLTLPYSTPIIEVSFINCDWPEN